MEHMLSEKSSRSAKVGDPAEPGAQSLAASQLALRDSCTSVFQTWCLGVQSL